MGAKTASGAKSRAIYQPQSDVLKSMRAWYFSLDAREARAFIERLRARARA